MLYEWGSQAGDIEAKGTEEEKDVNDAAAVNDCRYVKDTEQMQLRKRDLVMLYIVQMADFHFGGTCHSTESEEDILKKMTERILAEIPRDSRVVFCACGDYISTANQYRTATQHEH